MKELVLKQHNQTHYKFYEKLHNAVDGQTLVAIGYFKIADIPEYLNENEITHNNVTDIKRIFDEWTVENWVVSFNNDMYVGFENDNDMKNYINEFINNDKYAF